MDPTTRENLLTAMRGEAFAHAKYLLYAERARKNGHPELADLFERTAAVELFEHFAEEAALARLVGSDADNLRDALAGEAYEVETMYRQFAAQAEAAGEAVAAARFAEVRDDEAAHHRVFEAALRALDAS